MDQPEPDAPPAQDEPLVIPEAPEAPSGTPLTTSQMVDKCWSHVQAAVAAGQLIQARGWLRLYRELKPLVPYAEIEARRAAPETSPETSPGTSPEPDLQPEPPAPDPAADLVRLTTQLAAVARQAETAALQQDLAPPLHCFSAPESHQPTPHRRPTTGRPRRRRGRRSLARQGPRPPRRRAAGRHRPRRTDARRRNRETPVALFFAAGVSPLRTGAVRARPPPNPSSSGLSRGPISAPDTILYGPDHPARPGRPARDARRRGPSGQARG